MRNQIVPADILSAFNSNGVGTRVTDRATFEQILDDAVTDHDFAADEIPGQGSIVMPASVIPTVSCGVGRRSADRSHYHVRAHRGVDGLFLDRSHAATAEGVTAIVYTIDAYGKDPDVTPEELERVKGLGATHVLVAILASAGPRAPYGVQRLIRNLAGGNRQAEVWDGDRIRTLLSDSLAYSDAWSTVADREDGPEDRERFDRAVREAQLWDEFARELVAATELSGDEIRRRAMLFVEQRGG